MKYQEPKTPVPNKKKKDSVLDSFLRFCLKPRYNLGISENSFWRKFWNIISLLSAAIVFSFLFGLIVSAVMSLVGYDIAQNSVVELFDDAPVLFIVFMAMIWAPLVEETTFRLGLRFSSWKLSISLAFVSFTLFFIFVDYFPAIKTNIESYIDSTPLISLILTVLAVLFFLTLVLKYYIESVLGCDKVEAFYRDKFPYIFYLVAFLFGAIHLLNYNNFGEFWYVSFLLFMPQLSASFVLGYVRMRYGFSWSVLTHLLYNSFFTIPFLIVSQFPVGFLDGDEETINNLPDGELVVISLATIFILGMLIIVPIIFIKDVISLYRHRKKDKMI